MKKKRGEVVKVSALFEKYKKTLIAPQSSVVNAFIEVVYDLFEIKIPKDRVTYTPSNKTLSIIGRGPLKSEVQLHKKEILVHMRGRLGEKSAPTTIL